MLIPQFSLRWLLGLTTVCAVLFWVVRAGLDGNPLAGLVALSVLVGIVAIAVYAAAFCALWVIPRGVICFNRSETDRPGS